MKTSIATTEPAILIVKEKYSNQEYSVTIDKNKSIKIDCFYKNRISPKQTSITLNVNDCAEYDSFNLSYIGKITAITEKTVTIQPDYGERSRRLILSDFCNRNWDFDLEKKNKENSQTSYTL